jgi:hypothetical protein
MGSKLDTPTPDDRLLVPLPDVPAMNSSSRSMVSRLLMPVRRRTIPDGSTGEALHRTRAIGLAGFIHRSSGWH